MKTYNKETFLKRVGSLAIAVARILSMLGCVLFPMGKMTMKRISESDWMISMMKMTRMVINEWESTNRKNIDILA